MTDMLKNCQLCPRACGADRTKSRGACGAGIEIEAARASLHMWEEPPISGTNGSGTVFFSHCSLGCVFCQNRKISRREAEGQNITADALAKTFLSLEKKGAHNINLVTGAHYVLQIMKRCKLPENRGFRFLLYTIPADEQVETAQLPMVALTSICRIPIQQHYAGLYSHAEDYREFAVPAIDEMVRQTGAPQFDKNGLLKRGTVIRHLMLPGLAGDTAQVLRDIASRWGDSVLVSLMRQYTPFDMQDYPELDRTITAEEYADACTLFGELGLGGFFQQDESISESFIPAFDGTGLEEN
ncbi:MAG: radical SAM protein [Butyricicoccus sp.]